MKKIHLEKNLTDENYEAAEKIGNLVGSVAIIQLIIGIIFLIPPILGAIFFTLAMFGASGDAISLSELSTNWTGDSNAMSAAPVYLGLMAIAGTLIIHSAIKNLVSYFGSVKKYQGIDAIDDIEITEE